MYLLFKIRLYYSACPNLGGAITYAKHFFY